MGFAKVLVVDDQPDITLLLQVTLEAENLGEVFVANNAADAIDMAASLRPEIVILDYAMPDMNGEDCARHLRSIVPDADIVAFSAYLPVKPDWADGWIADKDLGELIEVMKARLRRRSACEPAPE